MNSTTQDFNGFSIKTRQFKNETHQPQELSKKGSSGTV